MTTTPTAQKKLDWSATQYLKFHNERTRPVHDLISQIKPQISSPHPRIYDLGCGPGNSTKALQDTFLDATITGIDSSPDMLSKARSYLPSIEFLSADLENWKPPPAKEGEQPDILFANAVFHCLRHDLRMHTITRFFESLKPGGVLAFQVPDNYHQPTHTLMRTVAGTPNTPWSKYFLPSDVRIGDLSDPGRPDFDPIEPPKEFYNALQPFGRVNTWRTEYHHVLKDARAIVEWVSGTGLQPYLQRMEDEEAKKAFLEEYEARLKEVYGELNGGGVLLGYPRLFVVAVRK